MSAQYRPPRLVIQWHLSDRCNLRCTHCYQEDFRGGDEGLGDWLARLEQFAAFVRPSGSAPAIPTRLTLTGGEPFALKGFTDLCEILAARRAEFDFAILTNGTLIDHGLAQRLKHWSPSYVQVSIDGSAPTHDAMRGNGSFTRAIAGIRALVAAGIRTLISFTATAGNRHEFPLVARLGRELGVDRVWTDRVIPVGQGEGAESLTASMTRDYMEAVARAKAEIESPVHWHGKRSGKPTEVAMHRALQFLAGGDQVYHCKAGDELIAVMPNGDVLPCRRLPIRVGNLALSSLAELYGSPLLQRLRDPSRIAAQCADCAYSGVCRGGLRCLAHALTGDFAQRDPGCWLAPPSAS